MNVEQAVNKVEHDDIVNALTPVRARRSVNRRPSALQLRILELAGRSQGVASKEAVIIIGGDRVQTREHSFYWNGSRPRVVGTRASRSVAAAVSRCLSMLLKRGLLELRKHNGYRDELQRRVDAEWRYHRKWPR